MLILDYVRASENKSHQFSAPELNVKGMQSHKSSQPSFKSLEESLKLQCSEIDLFRAKKDFSTPLHVVTGCEDDFARYVTILKIMIRKYSPQILHQLYDSERKTFPVFEQLLQYSFHEDVMIKNAARVGLLIILKECRDDVRNYIVQKGAPKYATNVTSFLRSITLNLQDLKKKSENSIKCVMQRFEEEIEYIDDIFGLDHEVVVNIFQITLIKQFVIPILISIAEQNSNTEGNEISLEIGLFIVGKLLQVVTDGKFKHEIIELLIPVELQKTRIHYFMAIFNTTSIKEIIKCRNKIVNNFKNIISSTKSNLPQIYAIQILREAIELFLYHNNHYGIFVAYKTYIELLMNYFLPEMCTSVLENKKLNLISSVLELLAKTSLEHNEEFQFELRNHFEKILQIYYLELCKKLKFDNISVFATIIDREYDDFLKSKPNFSNAFEDILYPVPHRNNDECQENVEYKEIQITLRKLFHLRCLCLHLHQKREKILPLLSNKIQIGDKSSTENCIPCEIMIHKSYSFKCFLKLTSNQILILQDSGNKKEGKVVFCSYYKDIFWKKYNGTLLLKEKRIRHKKISPIIQLNIKPLSKISIISKILTTAKQKQNEILKRKIEDLLETINCQDKRNMNEN